MTAATADIDTPRGEGVFRSIPVAANTIIYAGTIVVLNAGVAQPGTTALNLVAVGRAEAQANNQGGAAGAINVRVRRGTFLFANCAGADLIAEANIGEPCYIVDDNTVALTNGTNTRSVAGTIFEIDAATGNVWVTI